jgi:RNA polymerase sigma factor, TIGR02999 family
LLLHRQADAAQWIRVGYSIAMALDPAGPISDTAPSDNITGLLLAAGQGDRAALEACFPLVYQELKTIARRQRRAWHGNPTLNTTALIHEAYLKIVDQKHVGATSRAHFFAIASTAMRHILCNYARDRSRKKRGGEVEEVSLRHVDLASRTPDISDEAADSLTALADALERLGQISKRQCQVVECRFFAGLSVEETALALGVSPATVKRDWTFARAWLHREMDSLTL